MNRMMLALLPAVLACNAAADETRIERFVGCPVYRDTDAGRKSGCWLVDDPATGIRYDVTGGRIKPILGQQILVEGAVSSLDRNLCGGIVLEPVNVSVLPQPCKQHMIPAEGHPGRRFALPANLMQPSTLPRTLPPPPYTPREYTIEFELNSDFLVYQYSEVILEAASLYIKASKPRRVVITGYAATNGFEASGQRFREDISIARARADMVAEAFRRLGIPRELIHIEQRGETPAPAEHGLSESAKRRVTVLVDT